MRAPVAWVLIVSWMILWPTISAARVSGPCADCHTMHYTQGGELLLDWGQLGPYGALLVNDCVGCHQGTNPEGPPRNTPFVFDPDNATYGDTGTEAGTNTLAGGNFYWIQASGDRKGHNVLGVADQDVALGDVPPGGTDLGARLQCSGTYGCHGDRTVDDTYVAIRGAHHGIDDPDGNGVVDGEGDTTFTVGSSYRFLLGIVGKEDGDYEYQPSADNHNQYKGVDRLSDTLEDDSTISYLCAECHGTFHSGGGDDGVHVGTTFGSPWLRHPMDFDLGRAGTTGSEYAEYPGTGEGLSRGTYSVVSPVASENVTAVLSIVETDFPGANNAIVMCLSCHRAHGTPHDAILRWDFKSWPGPTGYNGCAVCHTSKD